jgi:hypothetical protein
MSAADSGFKHAAGKFVRCSCGTQVNVRRRGRGAQTAETANGRRNICILYLEATKRESQLQLGAYPI